MTETKVNLDDLELVGRTHFRKNNTQNQGWQWFWSTMTADEGEIVGVGGEGYSTLQGAINGFFSQQGLPSWEPGQALPGGYRLEKIDEQHSVIIKFAKKNNK
jgi:hypothetical protein